MRIFLVVKSFVPSHLIKDFDDWYEKEHLFEAKQTFLQFLLLEDGK